MFWVKLFLLEILNFVIYGMYNFFPLTNSYSIFCKVKD